MKKIITGIFITLIVIILPLNNTVSLLKNEKIIAESSYESADSLFATLEGVDTNEVELIIRKLEEKRIDPTGNKKKVEELLKNIKKGKISYRKALKDVYIVGDSLMNGLEAYDILNSNHLITQVSASLYHLSDNIEKIVKINPPILVLHYGINMISTSDEMKDNYISMYTKLIKKLKKKLPDTRIIVSGIFPVDREKATAKRFGKVDAYNKALKVMCKKLDVDFLDNKPLLKKHNDCYGSDGIHFSKKFYEKYWLNYLIKEMEIV